MKFAYVFLSLAFVSVGWQDKPKPETSKPDLTTPEKTLQTFVAAVSKNETLIAASCVEGAVASDALNELHRLENLPFNTVGQTIFGFTDLRIAAQGDSATATLIPTIESRVNDKTIDKMPRIPSEQLKLRRKGTEWKIVPEDLETVKTFFTNPDKAKGSVVAGYAAVYAHPDIFVPARHAAIRVTCRNRAKSLCLLTLLVIIDNDDKFAFKASEYKKFLLPEYLKDLKDRMAKESDKHWKFRIEAETKRELEFHCPLDAKDSSGFTFNANLQKTSANVIKEPARTVMFYDGANGRLDFRHLDKATVGFADGHVAQVDAQEAKKLLWLPYPNFKPVKP